MTAKEYLKQVRQIDFEIESKLVQVQTLKSLAARVNTVFSEMPCNSSPDSRLKKIRSEIDNLENEITMDTEHLVDLKREIKNVLKNIPYPLLGPLLEMRYLGYEKWEPIAHKLSIDVRYAYKLHKNGLDEVQKIIDLF